MNSFASGSKGSYYGKGDVTAYRLTRDGSEPAGANPVFGVNAKILIYGEAFQATYTTGDNTGLVATDSMKNFIQRETLNFPGFDLEAYCHFLATKFLNKYPQAEGAQLSAAEIPYQAVGSAFVPGRPERANACVELIRRGGAMVVAEAGSGIEGFRLLRLNGSAFKGFVRDEYTTLPDITNRPLHMWLDLKWTYLDSAAAFSGGAVSRNVRQIVYEVFGGFASGSIQQIIWQIGEKMLAVIPVIDEIRLEANNRTWDTIAESGDALGVWTDARPPYGCLGLTMKR